MATLTQIKARLAAIAAGISEVQRAAANAPYSLAAADLPFCGIFSGPAQYAGVGPASEADLETRVYMLRFYVRTYGSGIDGEAEALCEPFFESVPAAFAADPRLGRLVLDSTLLSDSGVVRLYYGGAYFIGIEFRLQVRR